MNPGVSALAVAVALAGCASNPVFEGDRAWNEGWREGKVEKVGTASELGDRHSYDCRYRNGGAGRDASGRFAVVAVLSMSKHTHRVLPVEPGKEPAVGDQVLTKSSNNCEPAIARNAK